MNILTRFKQWRCTHECDIASLHKTGEGEDSLRRVSATCFKCGKVLHAHCGLELNITKWNWEERRENHKVRN